MRFFYLSISFAVVVYMAFFFTARTFAKFNVPNKPAWGSRNTHNKHNPTPTPTNTPTPTATPTPVSSAPPRMNPVCVSAHLDRLSTDDIDKQLSLMQQAGVKWVRFDFVWAAMEKEKGTWDFSKYDYIINEAHAKGMDVIALLVQYGQPDYILQGRPYMTPPSTQDYTYFVTNASVHFKGKVKLYEIGNEPNNSVFWPPSPDVNAYVALLKAGDTMIKQNDPQAKVISAGLAPIDGWQNFLYGMYTAGVKGYFDYMGFHPYSWPNSPDTMTGTTFNNVATVLSIEQFYGDNKAIIGTEFGWPTFSGGVTESQQADYINRVYQKIMFENYQYVPIACVYDFINDGTNASDAEDNFGILRADYSLKPSFATLQQVRKSYDANFSPINP